MRVSVIVALICLVIGVAKSHAQDSLPDSLQQRFSGFPKDSTLINELNRVASVYVNINPALSRKIASHSSEIARSIDYTRGYARSLTVIGNSYWYEGIFEFAQTYYLVAARQYESIRDYVGLGQVYNNIGEVNKRLGNLEKALEYLKRSLNSRNNDTTLAITLYNIAEIYLAQENYPDASQYLEKSMKVAVERNDERSIQYNYWSMAKIKTAEGSFTEALPLFEKAIDGWKALGETRVLIQTYHDLAWEYLKLNKPAKAREYITLAEALEAGMGIADLKIQTYLIKSRIEASLGNFNNALNYLTLHNSLKDSIYTLLKAEQIARMQTIYESEMREKEMEQLKADTLVKEEQLRSKEGLIAAISASLIIVGILAAMLFQQRTRILKNNALLHGKNEEIRRQNESIELQAVTLRKLNEELQNFNKTLETRIEERSTQLLIQNQKLAEYSFVNAHKLRAPVASILGLIQLLGQALPEEREVILEHLKTCSEQLDTVIQEIGKNLES